MLYDTVFVPEEKRALSRNKLTEACRVAGFMLPIHASDDVIANVQTYIVHSKRLGGALTTLYSNVLR